MKDEPLVNDCKRSWENKQSSENWGACDHGLASSEL